MPRGKRLPRSSPKVVRNTVVVRQRQAEILALRIQGCTLDECAKRAGLAGRQGAADAIDRACKEIIAPNVEALRLIESERLHGVISAHWLKRANVASAKVVLQASAQLAKLHGLNAPVKHELSGPGGKPIEITDMSKLTDEQLERVARGIPLVDPGDGGTGDPAPSTPED